MLEVGVAHLMVPLELAVLVAVVRAELVVL
jgi:hypothetical protein